MIDNPTTVARLLEQMHDHLPIPAFPNKEIVRPLRRGGVKASVDRAISVKHVIYAGDEAGIACDLTPSRDQKQAVLASLTDLGLAPDHPLLPRIQAVLRYPRACLASGEP